MSDVGMAGEVGAHVLGGLLTTDFVIDRNLLTNDSFHRRLSSSLTYDDLEGLQRLTLGDFVTAPAQLGGSMRLGGISLSRRLALDPYFIRFPGQIVTGTAALPSEVFVYSNGVLVRRERIAPGAFELQNVTSLTGLSVTEVVVRDVLGNEQRIVNPFYFTDTVLRAGLDEYSFDAGLERRNFGITSTDYGSPGLSAFYRRGITDDLTLGVRGESLRDITNIGPSATARLGTLGVLGTALGLSSGPNGRAGAWALSHSYAAYRYATSVALRREARSYARVGAPLAGVRSELTGSLNWAAGPTTSMGLGLRRSDEWLGAQTRQWSATVNQRIGRDLTASVVAMRTTGTLSNTELFLTLGYQFGLGERPANASAQRHNFTGGSSTSVQLAGGANEEPGLGYRVQVRTDERAGNRADTINPVLRYNFDRVVARAEYFSNSGAPGTYQLAAAGAVATVGGYWGLSRPIFDSYGVAKVGDLPGIRVYSNFVEVGRTDQHGMVFIPRLASYFDNAVSIEPKDLPMDYAIPHVRASVVPALRSGVFVNFEVRRVRAVRGRLLARLEGAEKPLSSALGSVQSAGQQVEIFTSSDGSFYVEVGAGTHPGTAQSEAGTCTFTLVVPESEEVVTDLGTVLCDALQ